MGTIFYMFTDSKALKNKWFTLWDEYELTDEPSFGYLTEIAETSYGWKPALFQHEHINSVADLHHAVEDGWLLMDEYWQRYTWSEFETRVLDFNRKNPDAWSHIEKDREAGQCCFFSDTEGYEFLRTAVKYGRPDSSRWFHTLYDTSFDGG